MQHGNEVAADGAVSSPIAARPAGKSGWRGRLRPWDRVQLFAPWLLLAFSALIYFFWAAESAGHVWWPERVAVLGLILASALWVLFGHTIPAVRHGQRPAQTALYFAGLLLLAAVLMAYTEVLLAFAITGFFHAYLLRPWQAGLAGVAATSILLNGMTMRIWESTSGRTIAIFLLVVTVQTAAIGAGRLIASRSEADEKKREELVARLEETLHENAGLHAQLIVQARESGAIEERQRLAREIHDTLAQGLAGIITQLQAAHGSGKDAELHVDRALDLARSSLTEARRSVRALAPEELGNARLPEALRTLTGRWAEESTVAVSVEVTGERIPLSPAIEVALFRTVQEALTNVAKHAAASRVGVTLSYAGPEVLLDVRDDGRGFGADDGDGFGLTSMRQRVRGVGGQVVVQSAVGNGTSVSARVPAIVPGTGGAGDGSHSLATNQGAQEDDR